MHFPPDLYPRLFVLVALIGWTRSSARGQAHGGRRRRVAKRKGPRAGAEAQWRRFFIGPWSGEQEEDGLNQLRRRRSLLCVEHSSPILYLISEAW
jgi:hypothetical protein